MTSIPFSGMITHDGTITFTHLNGRSYSVLPSNPSYDAVMAKLREVQGNDDEGLRMELYELSQPKFIVSRSTNGRVVVEDNTVFYDGKPIRNFLAERIIWMIGKGFDAAPMLAFLENVKLNPSNRAVDELYRFMEANKMGLTKDGMILAYKRVRRDWLDIYTGTISNKIGDRPSMPRNEVNDNPGETCSHGLHVCAMSYLPCYRGAPGNHVVICRIHPKDVVSVPIEYANAKMRVCEYEVIGEITDHLDDILGRTPVWNEDDDSEEGWTALDDSDDPADHDGADETPSIRATLAAIQRDCPFDFSAFITKVTDAVYGAITTSPAISLEAWCKIHIDDPKDTLESLGFSEDQIGYIIHDIENRLDILIPDTIPSRFTPQSTVIDLINAAIQNSA